VASIIILPSPAMCIACRLVRFYFESLQIIVTAPVVLDLLLCYSRACLPREESRSFPTSSSGIRDSSRAPNTRAGMTEKFDRADVHATILCRTQ
jgi:hypothetical protein